MGKTKRGVEAWRSIEKHILLAAPLEKRPAFGRWPVRSITAGDVKEVVLEAARQRLNDKAGRVEGGPGIGRHTLRHVRDIFFRAVAERLVDCDPTSGLRVADLGIAQKRRKKWLDEETVPLFFEAIALGRMLAGDVSQEEGLSIQVRLGLGALVYVPVRSQSLISATVKELNLDPTPGEPPTWTIPASRIKKGEEAQVMPLPPTA